MSETVIKTRAISEKLHGDTEFLAGPHLEIIVHNATGIRNSSKPKRLRRPFVMFVVGNQKARTKSKKKTLDPVYNESLYFSINGIDVSSQEFNVTFECYDRSNISIAHKLLSIGGANIDFKELLKTQKLDISSKFLRGGSIHFSVYARNLIVSKKKIQSDCERLAELQQRQQNIDSFLKSRDSQQSENRVVLLQEKVLVEAKVKLIQEKILEARRLRVATLKREQEEHNEVLSNLRRAIQEEEKRQREEEAEENNRAEQERLQQEQDKIRALQMQRREQRGELHRQRTEKNQIRQELDKLERVRIEQEKLKQELASLEEQKRLMKEQAELEIQRLNEERQRLEAAVLEQQVLMQRSPTVAGPPTPVPQQEQTQPVTRSNSSLLLMMQQEEQKRQKEVEDMLIREEQEYLSEQIKFDRQSQQEKTSAFKPFKPSAQPMERFEEEPKNEITPDLIQSIKLKKTTPRNARESMIWKSVFG
ncbi:inner centromere protein A [Acrasis kona]|uniref:Inner centromere protein A n=1 Tax=Acrasis kona TaxID=1008807 RepID=A0AAW2Z3W9_9EUKA